MEAPPIVPVPGDGGGDLPLSLAQERLWFVDRVEPGSATYHTPLFVHLEGELDPDALRRALDEMVRRHESLRTSFPLVDGAPVQRVAPPAPAELVFHDLSTLREDEAARLVREQARLPFWPGDRPPLPRRPGEAGRGRPPPPRHAAPRDRRRLVAGRAMARDGGAVRLLLARRGVRTWRDGWGRMEPSRGCRSWTGWSRWWRSSAPP
ncbi:MAG TPA: condensation domain-containing protein [Longimicrobium sp.]|nr:condensation domain-containing protein [Longimicrobium sp.]